MLVLPFSSNTKAKAILHLNLERIERAIQASRYIFKDEVENLYPRLEKYGMKTPKIRHGFSMHEDTYYAHHFHGLEILSVAIRNNRFDLDSWNGRMERSESNFEDWLEFQASKQDHDAKN